LMTYFRPMRTLEILGNKFAEGIMIYRSMASTIDR
jgi:hypothetical protein